MKSFALKYGCNPNQSPARIFMESGADLPIEILNGKPGYINFLDAFNSYQLVKELKAALGLQARQPYLRRNRSSVVGEAEKSLLCGGYSRT